MKVPVLKKVLKEPQGIKTDDLFPVIEDLDRIQRYMAQEMGIGTLIDLKKFVDTRFAEVACDITKSVRHPSLVHDLSKVVSEIINRQETEHAIKTISDIEGKYLTFGLGKQEYGARILSVREIIGMMPIRALPQTPPSVKGVINLRDKVIPVIDLRLKFGMEELEYNERTCIIIMEVGKNDGTFQLGAVVDSVFEVLNVKAADIDDTPTFGVDIDTNLILGMAKMDGGVKILLDIDLILGAGEGEMIANVS